MNKNYTLLLLFFTFVPGNISTTELQLLNQLLSYLSVWKPHSEVVFAHSQVHDQRFGDIRSNFSVLLVTRHTQLTAKANNLADIIHQNRRPWRESLYIFHSNDTEEIWTFLEVVNQAENHSAAGSFMYFFVLQKSDGMSDEFHQKLKKAVKYLRLKSDAYIIHCCERPDERWDIYEFYLLTSTKLLINSIPWTNLGRKGSSRMDFQGVQLRATAPKENLTQGEIVWDKDSNGNHILHFGFGTSILKALQHSLNFVIDAIPTDGWATQFENGSWNGMANEVLSGRADIGIAKTSILPARAKALGYLIPIHKLIVTAFFRQPPISSVRNIFIHPFEIKLWLTIICTWILILFAALSMAFIRLKSLKSDGDEFDHKDNIVMEGSGVWAISAITQHGFYVTPNSMSMRIVFFIGLCLGVIIFVAYAATLTSIFTSKSIPIKTFDELVKSDVVLTVDGNNAGAKLVAIRNSDRGKTNSETLNLLMEKIAKGGNNSLLNATYGGGLVFQKNVAFLTFPDTFFTTIGNAYHTTDRVLCNSVSLLPVTTIPFRSGLFVAKNSPYKDIFNNRILCLYASGIMKRYVQHYEATYTPVCNPELEVKETPSLGPSDVFSVYILLLCGFGAAGLILVTEVVACRRLKNNIATISFRLP